MKDKIIQLRKEGKSYNTICDLLGCAKSTVAYHCGEGQKDKNKLRSQRNREQHTICNKIRHFCRKAVQDKTDGFQRERLKPGCKSKWRRLGKHLPKTFTYREVVNKFGVETECYLTGRPINLLDPKTYNFDHKVPTSKGGGYEIENLGITCREANIAKSDLLLPEFIQLCKEVLEKNGYEVSVQNKQH